MSMAGSQTAQPLSPRSQTAAAAAAAAAARMAAHADHTQVATMHEGSAAAATSPSTQQFTHGELGAHELPKVVLEARKKFAMVMDSELLDYKHNHPQVIENCATMLIRVFDNILQHPGEDKYRQIKGTSNALKANVSAARGGEHLLTLAGFKIQVVDLQKFWVFESDSHGIKDSILRECCGVLQRAIATIHEKAERKRREGEGKSSQEQQRREQILLALEDDKALRKLRAQTTPVMAPVAATPLPSAVQKGAPPRRAGGQPQGEEEEDSD